jgi:hypothetical protein
LLVFAGTPPARAQQKEKSGTAEDGPGPSAVIKPDKPEPGGTEPVSPAANTGQEPASKERPKPEEAASDLILGAPAPSMMSEGEVEETFVRAINQTQDCSHAGVKAQAVPESTYRAVEKFLGGGRRDVGRAGEEFIERSRDDSPCWRIEFPDALVELASLDLKYVASEKECTETFKVEGKTTKDARLRFYSPGVYLLRTDENWVPKQYKLNMEEGGAAMQGWKDWPAAKRYFLIKISEFRGSTKALFETLRQPEKVGTALQSVQLVRPTTFVLADFTVTPPTVTDGWDGNHFVVRFNKPQNSFPSKVWMLFPLTTDELRTARDRVAKGKCTPEKLAAAIKEGKARPGGLSYDACGADQEAALTPGMAPTWFEVPKKAKDGAETAEIFERSLRVDDVATWKKDARATQVFRLVAFQFDPPAESAAPEKKPSPPLILRVTQGGQVGVLCVEQDVPAWPIGLQKAGDKP